MTGTVTQTEFNTWQHCKMKHWLQFAAGGFGVVPSEPYLPFLQGEFFHYAVAKWRKTGRMQRVHLERRLGKMIDGIGAQKPEVMDKLETGLAMSQAAALGYTEANRQDLEDYKFLAVEAPGSFMLAGTKVHFKIDAVAEDKKKRLILWENKFLASVGTDTIITLPVNFQLWTYIRGVEALFGRLPDLVIFDVTLKSMLRRKQSKTGGFETPQEYHERIRQQYVQDRDETTGRLKMFERQTMPVEKNLLLAAEDSIRKDMSAIGTLVPTFSFQCIERFGQVCQYLPACIARMSKHEEGWNAPECKGLFLKKAMKYPELMEEKEDDEKDAGGGGSTNSGTGQCGNHDVEPGPGLPQGNPSVAGAAQDGKDIDGSGARKLGAKAKG